jgi:DNA polymerase sigma
VTARVPVLKVIDRGTGVECDISVENKDGMSRSVIFKFISSIDERFRILCYLVL